MTLTHCPNQNFWQPQGGLALYVYKLLVARDHGGQGIGADIGP